MLKRKIKTCLAIFIILISAIFLISYFANTDSLRSAGDRLDNQIVDVKTYYVESDIDDYNGGQVIITLNKESTDKFLTYTPSDFPEIDCVAVNDLMKSTMEYVRRQGDKKDGHKLINYKNYRRILSLELRDKSKANTLNAINSLNKRQDVISAEPNIIKKLTSTISDSNISEQWGMFKINAPSAWDISTGSNKVQVGILDSGIDANHVDLKNNISSQPLHRDFTSGVEVKINDPIDDYGHGTHVAGIIGAQGNNGIGVAGINWKIELVSLKIFNQDGKSDNAILAQAIDYAALNNIAILNFSGGGTHDVSLQNAIANYGGLFVCAAGNHSENIDENPYFPAAYNMDNVITVGASDINDQKSDWNDFNNLWGLFGKAGSCYGKKSVDLFAPGTDILSTVPDSKYQSMSGTSMATPMVTGVAALLLSNYPTLTPNQLKSAILDNVDQIDSFKDLCVSGGRLNAFKAMQSIKYGLKDISNDTAEITKVYFDINNSYTVPASIDGKKIISIGVSAFENTGIGELVITDGIENIGSNAFANCAKLTSVTIPKSVKFIASDAFDNCPNLAAINVDADNQFYKSINGVLYTQDATKLLLYPAGKDDADYVVNNATKTIAASAFLGQRYIQNVTLNNVERINESAFKDAKGLQNIIDHEHVAYIENNAFENTKWLDNRTASLILGKVFVKHYANSLIQPFKIPDGIVQIADHAFENSNIELITLPSSLYSIGDFAFNNCNLLLKVVIPQNIKEIGNAAFANCSDLKDISLLNTIPPRIGNKLFTGLTNFIICIPSLYRNDYESNNEWKNYKDRFDVKKITVQFDTNGLDVIIDPMTVDYYSYINNLPYNSRDYYLFRGWYCNDQLITDGSIFSFYGEKITLKARWDAKNYRIGYIVRNGSNVTENVKQYTVESGVTFYDAIPKDGYYFAGWYLNANFTGDRIYSIPVGGNGNKVLYAKILPIQYIVNLDVNDTEDTPAYVNPSILTNIEYNQSNSMPIPIREGYLFLGWYDQKSGGTQYSNGQGVAVIPWNKTANTTLYAHWEAEQYYILITIDGTIKWLGTHGLSDVQIPLSFGQEFQCPASLALELVHAPSMKPGYKFLYFLAPNGEPLHKVFHTVPDYGENGAIYAITAAWQIEEHSIYFDSNGGTSVKNIENVEYDKQLNLYLHTPIKLGYHFVGWSVKNDIAGFPKGSIFDYYTMPDLTIYAQQNGSIGLIAVWEFATYTIYFDSNGGSIVQSKNVTYTMLPSDYDVPVREGYIFDGWFDSRDYAIKYSDANGQPTKSWDKTYAADLYAKWLVRTYTITYELDGGTNNVNNVTTYTIEDTVGLYSPYKTGYDFEGWYDTVNKNYCAYIPVYSTGDKVFKAQWFADTSIITNIGGTYTYTSKKVVVDVTSANINSIYKFVVAQSVNEITFTSNIYILTPLNMSIVCNSRSTNLKININNVNIAPKTNDTHAISITGNNIGLYLHYTGINTIVGANGTSNYGENQLGLPGAAGIYAHNNNVYLSGNGNLDIYGGQGGASGKGIDGINGTAGNDAKIVIGHGGNGSDGSTGAMGMVGAKGGYGIDAVYVGIDGTATDLQIYGGDGGRGGTGGRGGDGGRGGHGGGSLLICMNGGIGGRGGDGGLGGNGGEGSIGISGNYNISPSNIHKGSMGIKGFGGRGGDGGYGGANGASSINTGTHGNGGQGGNGGLPGNGTHSSNVNDSYYYGSNGHAGGYYYTTWGNQ